MKKTLVALAVLAASGATFAQVTITGQYGYGYASKTTGAAPAVGPFAATTAGTSSGLGISDSNISFNVGEDLGGGLKVAANIKLDGVSRAAVNGGDESISLSGAFGTLSMGIAEYDTDLPDQFGTFLGATTVSSALVDSERTSDYIQYATAFGPVGVSVRHTEAAGTNRGIGAGAAGSGIAQRLNTVAASYAAGPLTVKFDYSVYDNKDQGAPSVATFDNRTTLGGNYDFGVASLGLGVQNVKWTQGLSVADTFVGVKVPVGALVVGVDYLNTKFDGSGAATVDKTYNGWGVQAQYNLSKRTDVRFRYASYDGALAATDKTTASQLVLQHSF